MNNYEILIIPLLSDNYSFIIWNKTTNQTACVDPATDQPIIDALTKHKLKLDFIINTHHHPDHVGGNIALKKFYDCKIVGFIEDAYRIPEIDIKLNENDIFSLGELKFKILFIPGHTKGHIAYYNAQENLLFCGDTIFSSGCGRIFDGTITDLYNSIQRIKSLPDETKIYCAHEYTKNNIEFALSVEPNNLALQEKYQLTLELRKKNIATIPTNIEQEKATNPFFRTDSHEIINNIGNIRNERDLFIKLREMKNIFY